MTDETNPTIATELYIAKRYAELGEYQEMYRHIFSAMNEVPRDFGVGWNYHVTYHDDVNGNQAGDGFGFAPDPITQIQSVLYDNNDVGVDAIRIEPAGGDDDS